jgi:hypothetical protein
MLSVIGWNIWRFDSAPSKNELFLKTSKIAQSFVKYCPFNRRKNIQKYE